MTLNTSYQATESTEEEMSKICYFVSERDTTVVVIFWCLRIMLRMQHLRESRCFLNVWSRAYYHSTETLFKKNTENRQQNEYNQDPA